MAMRHSIIRGSALAAAEGTNDELGKEKILELMQHVDEKFQNRFEIWINHFSCRLKMSFPLQDVVRS